MRTQVSADQRVHPSLYTAPTWKRTYRETQGVKEESKELVLFCPLPTNYSLCPWVPLFQTNAHVQNPAYTFMECIALEMGSLHVYRI